jgi:hypothetical protein
MNTHIPKLSQPYFEKNVRMRLTLSKWGLGSPPGLRHYIGKLLTRVTTLVQTSSRSEDCTISYSPAKLRDSKPR